MLSTKHNMRLLKLMASLQILWLMIITGKHLIVVSDGAFETGGLFFSGNPLRLGEAVSVPSPTSLALILFGITLALLMLGYLGRHLPYAFTMVVMGIVLLSGLVTMFAITILSQNAVNVLAFVWLMLVGSGSGLRLLRWMRIVSEYPSENLFFAATLGLGVLSILGFLLAALGWLTKTHLLAILGILTILLIKDIWSLVRTIQRVAQDWRMQVAEHYRSPLLLPLTVLLTLTLVIAYMQALAPEVQADAVIYQLAVPQVYIEQGKLVEIPHNFRSYFAKGANFQFMLGLLLADEATAKLFSYIPGVLTALLLVNLSVRYLKSHQAGLIAAAFFLLMPITGIYAVRAYVDATVILFVSACLAAFFIWHSTQRVGWLIVSGTCGGLAMFVKLNAAFVLLPSGLVMLLMFRPYVPLRQMIKRGVLFALPLLLVGLPWYLLTLAWTHNPVFPNLNEIFPSPLYPRDVASTDLFAQYGIGRSPSALLLTPWRVSFDTVKHNPPIFGSGLVGICVLAGFGVLFTLTWSKRKSFLSSLLAIAFLSFLLWGLYVPNLRYIAPVMPVFAWLTAYVFHWLLDLLARARNGQQALLRWGVRITLHGVLLLALVSSLQGMLNAWWYIPGRLPLAYATGQESREEFLSRSIFYYDAYRYLTNFQDFAPTVLAIAIHNNYHYRPASQIFQLHWLEMPFYPLIESTDSQSELGKILEQFGITHIVIDPQNRLNGPGVELFLNEEFRQRYLHPEYGNNDVLVFRFIPSGRDALPAGDNDEINLLANASFELHESGKLVDWWNIGDPQITCSAEAYHRACSGVVDHTNHVAQVAEVTSGAVYEYAVFAQPATATLDRRSLVLQVNWLSADGQLIDVTMASREIPENWGQVWTLVTAPDGAATGVFYIRTSSGVSAVIDDVHLYQYESDLTGLEPYREPPTFWEIKQVIKQVVADASDLTLLEN